MNAFIKKTVIFLILAIIALIAVLLIPNAIAKSEANFKINKDVSAVIFGHSHPSYAFNDSIISNIKNLADAGESYFYTYQKVKNIIPNNPQIKTVFIEYTNNQIDTKMNDWTWGFDQMSYFLPIYAPFLDQEDYELLYQKNSKDLAACVSIATKKNIERSVKGRFNVIEIIVGYEWSDINKLDDTMLEKAKSDTTNYGTDYKVSQSNINYLKKIIDLCKANNKDVFLVRSPQHSDLPYLKNELHYQNIKKKYFNDVPLLDFNSLKLPDTYYVDLDHVNYKGAEVFSEMFNQLLNNNLLDNPNKKLQIDEAIVNYSLIK